ncbi:MAG: ArsI/CadI family heavy metal resistance metalloenzyme [Pyrinomonadaceae bacterium]
MNVSNVAESTEFYKKLFGTGPLKYITKVRPGYAKFDLTDPPLNLAINEAPHVKGGSLSHLGIQVETSEDVLRMRERWISEGLITKDQMQVDCCYALQDKTWARDPDGNEWEVFVVLENTDPAAQACGCGSNVEREDPHLRMLHI